ncbi:hypothetical protein RA210_U680001 [Rubrivivax sp. A210]|uniref:hypothetical protein n=1 Tax=Rubrivivax sp. A210 TaxID=2772301 RepID=UPI0019187944|nr:hypothetical protein [Rubrivivax sp. A210]CAD5374680.1 hypothetical protein RA210_U680001 [Rubrivivax sp. A210]
MNDASKELYVLHHLTLVDMERVARSIQYLSTVTDKHIREALFRDAVVCYVKAFSSNNGIKGKRGLRISNAFIPSALIDAHDQILDLRNKLFAHVDLDNQAPDVKVEIRDGRKHVSFSVKGYERIFAEHLVQPLGVLANKAHSHCMEQLNSPL